MHSAWQRGWPHWLKGWLKTGAWKVALEPEGRNVCFKRRRITGVISSTVSFHALSPLADRTFVNFGRTLRQDSFSGKRDAAEASCEQRWYRVTTPFADILSARGFLM